jgi:FKBP-type peptidyl-prolyl cis-trans isomerase FkpA
MTALITLLTTPVFAVEGVKTEEQKTLYSVGIIMAQPLSVLSLTPDEFAIVQQGMADATMGKPLQVDMEGYRKKAQDLAAARRDAHGQKMAALGKEYLDKAAQEKGAVKTASGVIYQSLKEGNGVSPKGSDKVKVNYRGTFVDGKEFDNSFLRAKPIEFPLSNFIKCWSEGVQMMKQGGKAKLVCPPETAYGNKSSGLIPANATLAFEIELLEVTAAAAKQPEKEGHAGL